MQVSVYKNNKAVHALTRRAWRNWLQKNHQLETAVWLIIFHKSSGMKTVSYEEAVEEALCFGWIDSVANRRDAQSKYQYFARRKQGSMWSKSNRERAEKMISEGGMTPAGQQMIDWAKANGTWEALVQVQEGIIPDDLQALLNKNKTALKNFLAFPPSSKRIILEWILNAKKEDTRKKRIEETVRLAAENIRANHYRQ